LIALCNIATFNINKSLRSSHIMICWSIGSNNFASGINTLNSNNGNSNIGIGFNTLFGNTGSNNIALGNTALYGNNGNYNISIGYGLNGNTGSNNITLGHSSLNNIIGNSNCSIGNNNTIPNGNTGTFLFGNNITATGSNQAWIGNNTTTTYINNVQYTSDLRDKSDVRDTILGLNFISKLKPVDYKWDFRNDYKDNNKDGSKKGNRFHHGVIAQDIETIIKDTGIDFGGFQSHSYNGGNDKLTIGYIEFIAPMIKAIQELNNKIIELNEKVNNLTNNN
jgi:hypothetical protein